MKLNGFVGKGTGKLGASVFAISGGEQIVRQYNPAVSNPNTDAQIEQRAKLKLMSQLAAVFAPVIAIPKQGLKSSRNLFISKNFGLTSYEKDTAKCELEAIQLTNGNIVTPIVRVTRGDNSTFEVRMGADATGQADRVVYASFQVGPTGEMVLFDSKVVEVAGENGTFPTTLNAIPDVAYVYAFGMKDKNAGATIKYNEYSIITAEDVAALIVGKQLTAADFALTKTTCTKVAAAG